MDGHFLPPDCIPHHAARCMRGIAAPGMCGPPAPRYRRTRCRTAWHPGCAVIDRFERNFLAAALARHQGNISKAAEEIGMYRQQLQQKLVELGMDADQFRRKSGE
jgi:transcriptional regulator with GAF, ATPase, and Fis domain